MKIVLQYHKINLRLHVPFLLKNATIPASNFSCQKYFLSIELADFLTCYFLLYTYEESIRFANTVECRLSGQVGTEANPDNEKSG